MDKETGTLGERIRTLFKEQGITIVFILTAVGMAIGVLIEALLGGPSASTPKSGGTSGGDTKGGAREWIKNKLKALSQLLLECYMDWFPSLICKNYIFKHFVKTVEPTSLKFCMIIELITLHLEYTIAQVKYANFSYVHAQTFVLLNGEMATVSTGFRKLKFWLWLLWTVFYLSQTGF